MLSSHQSPYQIKKPPHFNSHFPDDPDLANSSQFSARRKPSGISGLACGTVCSPLTKPSASKHSRKLKTTTQTIENHPLALFFLYPLLDSSVAGSAPFTPVLQLSKASTHVDNLLINMYK